MRETIKSIQAQYEETEIILKQALSLSRITMIGVDRLFRRYFWLDIGVNPFLVKSRGRPKLSELKFAPWASGRLLVELNCSIDGTSCWNCFTTEKEVFEI